MEDDVRRAIDERTENLKKTIKEICQDYKNIFPFAYEVRKQDAEQEFKNISVRNYYTELIFDEETVEIEYIVRQVILINKWNVERQKMEVTTNSYFKLHYGEEFQYELRYDTKKNPIKPFIISGKPEEVDEGEIDNPMLLYLN